MAVLPFLSEHGFVTGDMAKVAGQNTVKLGWFCMARAKTISEISLKAGNLI